MCSELARLEKPYTFGHRVTRRAEFHDSNVRRTSRLLHARWQRQAGLWQRLRLPTLTYGPIGIATIELSTKLRLLCYPPLIPNDYSM